MEDDISVYMVAANNHHGPYEPQSRLWMVGPFKDGHEVLCRGCILAPAKVLM